MQDLFLHQDGKIGQGAFGSVYRVCQDSKENCNLALKVIPKWYEEEVGECKGTEKASRQGWAPHFRGCRALPDSWSSQFHLLEGQEYIGLLMDLHGMALSDYLLAVDDDEKIKKVLASFQQLEKQLILHKVPRDPNSANYVVKEHPVQVLGIDWVDWKDQNKSVSLLEKLKLQKQAHDQTEKRVAQVLAEAQLTKESPPRVKTAKEKLKWLHDWEQSSFKSESPKRKRKRTE